MKKLLLLFFVWLCVLCETKAQCTDNNVQIFFILSDAIGQPLVISDSELREYTCTASFGGQTVNITDISNMDLGDGTVAPLVYIDLQYFSALIQMGISVNVVLNMGGRTITTTVERTSCADAIVVYPDVTPPVIPPSLVFTGGSMLCAGGGSVSMRIDNAPTDLSANYTLKVVPTPPATGTFSISSLGSMPITIAANAGTTAGSFTVQLLKNGEPAPVATTSLTVGTVPTIAIKPSRKDGSNGYYCKGGPTIENTVDLSVDPIAGYSFKWTKPDLTQPAPTTKLTVNVAGTYKVEATKTGACPATALIEVVEKTAPGAPVIKSPNPADVCKSGGGTTTLEVNSPTVGNSYIWSTGASNAGTLQVAHSTVALGMSSPVSGGTAYKVKVNDGKCTSNESIEVKLFAHQISLALNPAGSSAVASNSEPTVTATATLNPSAGKVDATSWSWATTGGGIASGDGTGVIKTNPITQTSTYQATASDEFGCEATSPVTTFTVKQGTAWDITLANKGGCIGSKINLAPTFAPNAPLAPLTCTWTSSNDLTFTSPNSQSTDVSAATPGVYHAKITVRDANNVEKSKEIEVTVFGRPTLDGVQATSADVCKGDKVNLEAVNPAAATPAFGNPGTLTYVWGGANALADKKTAQATLATGNNKYTLKVTDGNGCASDERNVTVVGHEVTVPTVTLSVGGTGVTTVPYGSVGTLSCAPRYNPAGGTPQAYLWTPTPGINGEDNLATATTIALTTAGAYSVEVTDNNKCKGKGTVNFTISGGALTVATQAAEICAGAATTLSCTPSGGSGSGAITYKWISVDGRLSFNDATLANPQIATTTPGVYPVKVEIKKGVQTAESAEVMITIGAQPKLAGIAIHLAGNPNPIGGGGASILPGSVIEAIVTPTTLPADTKYNWTSTPAGLIAQESGDHLTATSVKLNSPGVPCFELVVTNADGECPARVEACVTVAGKAFEVTMENVTVCAGTSPVISSSGKVLGGVTPYGEYTWTCANPAFHYTVSGDGTAITVLPATVAGAYTVKLEVKDAKGNIASKDFVVTVDGMPSFVAVSTTPQTVKVGTTVTLSASATPITSVLTWTARGPKEGAQQGTTGTASIVAGVFTTATTAGVPFQYEVEAANGTCKRDTTVLINVIDKTADIVITADDVEACEVKDGNMVGGTLTVDATGGGTGGLSYRWQVVAGDDMTLANTTGKTATIASATPGTHSVIVYVTDHSADPAPPQQKTVTVTVYENPVIDAIVVTNVATGDVGTTVGVGDELELAATVTPFNAPCMWTESGSGSSLVSNTGSTVFTTPVTDTKTYTVTATAHGKCTASRNVTVTVDKPTTGALLELSLEKKCADSGESMILSMKASGGLTYSFTLKNNAGLDKAFTGSGPWQHPIALEDQDTYFVQNFKAFKNGVEITPVKVNPSQIEALFYTIPVITIVNGNVQTICRGNALTLSASSQLSGANYTWNKNVVNGEAFVPQESDMYTVTAESDKGCIAKSDVTVTMIEKPTVTVGASPETICLGDTVTLTAGGTATEFVWNNGQKGVSVTVVPNVGGTVRYVVIGKELLNGCSDTATVKVVVNEPPKITAASKPVRSIAIGKSVVFGVKATGKNLSYEWQRWTGSSWLTLYDASSDQPTVRGSHSDSLFLGDVPQGWDGTKLQCVVTNSCGVADTSFLLNVKECFDILDVEWDLCHGIRPEKDPTVAIDGWYCPGSRIAVCARLVLDDPDVEIENAVYKWTVDGLSTTDGRWGEMTFLSDSSILSWVPPVEWQDNITIAVCAYVDGACDTVCKKYLRLKAMKYTDLAWEMRTSIDPTRMFCPGDTVTCWIDDPNKTAGLNPTYRWYNDIFDLQVESSPYNDVVSLTNEQVVMSMGQQDSWMKVIMTPSPEICTREPQYADTAFLRVKKFVEPSLRIDCVDTIACRGDSVRMSAIYANAGLNPTFQWQRSVGDPFPDWNLGTKPNAVVHLDEDDVWVKCVMKPSSDVCYDRTKPIVDAIKIRVLQTEGSIQIACDLKDKEPGDELVFTSEVKGILGDHKYEWMVNERLAPEGDSEYVCNTLRPGDVVYCMVSGERLCQSRIRSNEITVNFGRTSRDTIVTIYRNERIQNLKLFKAGDEGSLFVIDKFPHDGVALLTLLGGQFNYVPNRNFTGVDYVHYLVKDKFNPNKVEEGHIYINVKENGLDNLPNVITPNGDGLNDEWHLETITGKYTNYEITVYNRIGNVVFRCRGDYANDWNGQSTSNPNYEMPLGILQSGIYTYVISLDKGQKKIMSWLEIRGNLGRGSYR